MIIILFECIATSSFVTTNLILVKKCLWVHGTRELTARHNPRTSPVCNVGDRWCLRMSTLGRGGRDGIRWRGIKISNSCLFSHSHLPLPFTSPLNVRWMTPGSSQLDSQQLGQGMDQVSRLHERSLTVPHSLTPRPVCISTSNGSLC